MAADEKRVRVSITGDASGLNKEFERVQKDAKKAFSDIGLDGILQKADSEFANINKRIAEVGKALKDKKAEADKYFDERASKATNDFSKSRVSKDRGEYEDKQEEAWDKWTKLADYLKDQIKKGKIDSNGNIIPPKPPSDEDEDDPKKLSLAQRVTLRSIQGGRLNLSGGAQEAVAGEGGLAQSAGLGIGGTLIAGAVFAGLAALFAKSLQLGLQSVKDENKLSAKFDIDRGNFATDSYDGLSSNELKQYILSQANSRTSATDIQNISKKRLDLKFGYGLEDNDVQGFDRFRQQDSRGTEGSRLIADILLRSERRGILGVSGSDFTLLPQKIEQVANIMTLQKSNGESVDSNSAIGLIMAGTKIGGRFGDDRAGEAFGRIDSNIKNPGNPGMKAFIFEQLRRANPKGNYTDILADMENGASSHNLNAILPSISRMPQGEMRRMMLHQFTGNWQDARRLDGAGNLDEMLKSLKEHPISDLEAEKKYGETKSRAQGNIDFVTSIGSKIESGLTNFGNAFVKPINDVVSGRSTVGGAMMNSPAYNPMLSPLNPLSPTSPTMMPIIFLNSLKKGNRK